ncbi:HD-GYP domain-containing protein [Heliomicrobium undosum]|nr:HD domain-containing phosphohydrolase [Heliomicrobium undosum]
MARSLAVAKTGGDEDSWEQFLFWMMESIRCPGRWALMRRIRDWDAQLFQHSLRVAAYSRIVGREVFGFDQDREQQLVLGAFFHDTGKVGWPNRLKAVAVLSEQDLRFIRCHPDTGADLVQEFWPDAPATVLEIIRNHHERPDGSGYPNGTTVQEPMALIVGAADMFAAMTEPRDYRRFAFMSDKAAEELRTYGYPEEIVTSLVRQQNE